MYDYIVIGGGLSGTAFAHFAARRGKTVCLLEKNDRLGGCIHSVQPDPDKSYFVEFGAHTIYRSYATMIEIIENTGRKTDIIPQTKQPYKIWDKGVKSIMNGASFFKLLTGAFKMGAPKKGKTVEQFYTEVFGEQNYKNIVHPATSAIICQDSGDVAADLLLKRRPKNKAYPKSFTMKGGLSSIVEASVQIKGIDVELSAEAASITKNAEGYTVKTVDGRTFTGIKLAMAASADVAGRLLADVHPEIGAMLEKLAIKTSRAVGFCTAKENVDMPLFGYLIGRNSPFTSVVSRDIVPDERYRGATFHFKPSESTENDMQIINVTYKMKDSSAIYRDSDSFSLPQLGVGHHEWRKELEELLAKAEDFHLLGNFFDGLSMEDCLIRGKEEALRD